jgi:nitroreductase
MKEIAEWKSIRRYQQKEVELKKIKAVLEAGRRAPSWQNLQPWHFLVLVDEKKKEILSKIVVTNKIVLNAPVSIVLLGNLEGFGLHEAMEKIKEQVPAKFTEEDIQHYLQNKTASPSLCGPDKVLARTLEQLSYAAAFMILEAARQGLGSCIVGGIENGLTVKSDQYVNVKFELNIPDEYDILNIITLGYSAENPGLRSRKSMEKVSSLNAFGKPLE